MQRDGVAATTQRRSVISVTSKAHLNSGLLRDIILSSDELNEGACAGFAGPHVADSVMAAHVASNIGQQLWSQNVLAYLLPTNKLTA